jgi:ribosomal protein L40E
MFPPAPPTAATGGAAEAFCDRCGQANAVGFQFCRRCGAQRTSI